MNIEYVRVPVIYRVNQAECVIHILVAASQEYVITYRVNPRFTLEWGGVLGVNISSSHFSLYKILFHFKALFWESFIFLPPPPLLQSLPLCNTIARPLRCVRPPTDPPLYNAIHHKISVMSISCKG